MAIQPVDLQLAYLAAPQSAAVASTTQQAPASAQAAAQSAFAAQVQQREETVAEPAKTEGAKVRPDAERRGDAGSYSSRKRRQLYRADTGVAETVTVETLGEQHFIDTTA